MDNPEVNKYVKILFVFASVGIIFVFGFFSGRFSLSISYPTGIINSLNTQNSPTQSAVLDEVWTQVTQNYLKTDLNNKDLIYGAAKGIIHGLHDEYSQFLTPEDTQKYNQSAGSKFEGIGAILRFNGKYTVINTPIDGFPAQKAGLMPGDLITKVAKVDVVGNGAAEVADLIKGPAGTNINITIFRPKDKKELMFDIIRKSIDINNVELIDIKDGIAHLKISKFNESSTAEFIKLWDDAVKKVNNANVNSIILDLRNNPGGLVNLVQYISEEFLNKGDLVMSEEERDGKRVEFRSTRDGRFMGKKVIILINQGSASASEILTGALIDNNRAQTVGMPTVGKGVEQKLISLSDGSTMHLVFRRWLMPKGRQVTKKDPITPDYKVDLSTEDFKNGLDPQLNKAIELLRSVPFLKR